MQLMFYQKLHQYGTAAFVNLSGRTAGTAHCTLHSGAPRRDITAVTSAQSTRVWKNKRFLSTSCSGVVCTHLYVGMPFYSLSW